MQKNGVIVLIVVVLLLCVAAFATYLIKIAPNDAPNSDAKKTLATTEAQVFTDLDGNPLSLEQFEGKVRVVNSWASWTPFSAQELKDLEELARVYKDREVVVIAINRMESKEFAKSYIESLGAFLDIIIGIDVNDTYYATIGGYAMPETVFYDTQGNIIFHKRGSMTYAEMEQNLQKVLGNKD